MKQLEAIETDRLLMSPLSLVDDKFILELVNSEGWLRFIGERNVKTVEDAQKYIHKILEAQNVDYHVVRLKADKRSLGVVTYIKKDYLDFPDIGFAFLPRYSGMGYAFEASKALLNKVLSDSNIPNICATTVPENVKSIQLLSKLGFQFQGTIEDSGTSLSVYELTEDRTAIDRLILRFFSVFDNRNGTQVHIDSLRELCSAGVSIYKKSTTGLIHDSLDSFIASRQDLFDKGVFTSFFEYETGSDNTILGNLAQRRSSYSKHWKQGNEAFYQNGTKLFQLVKDQVGWKLCAILWEDEPISEQEL